MDQKEDRIPNKKNENSDIAIKKDISQDSVRKA